MGLQKFSNNAASTTATTISVSGTSFDVQAAAGAEFPSITGDEYFYVRLGTNASNEVVKVTARSSDTFTCEATASGWAIGTPVVLTVSAEALGDMAQNSGDGDTLTGHKLADYTEARATPASSAGTLTLDYASGPVFASTLTEAVTTLAFSNLPATGQAARVTLILIQDGTGGWGVTWPGSVDWIRGEPDLDIQANAVSVITLITVDGGTTWYGIPHGNARPRVVALSDAATIAVNSDGLDQMKVTLAGNRTLGADSGTPYDGKLLLLEITQDGTGSRTLAYTGTATGWTFTTDVPEPTLSTAAGAIDYELWRYHASDDRWHCLAVNLGA